MIESRFDSKYLITNIIEDKQPSSGRFGDFLNMCLYNAGLLKMENYTGKDPVKYLQSHAGKSNNWRDYRLNAWKYAALPKAPMCLCLQSEKKASAIESETHTKYISSLRAIEADIRHDQAKITASQLGSIVSRINSLELLLSNFKESNTLPEGISQELISLKTQVARIQADLKKLVEE